MTDLEITRLCAEAMGCTVPELKWEFGGYVRCRLPDGGWFNANPLHDDAQAMALVFWLAQQGVLSFGTRHLLFDYSDLGRCWIDYDGTKNGPNRAICECVAKMQKAKQKERA